MIFLRLGKKTPRLDERTLRMAALVRPGLAPPPREFDFDLVHPGVPTPMDCNDELGCCVISARAHQTRRFELLEQKKVIAITPEDIKREYFAQSGGEDSGLVMLDSLKAWRKGWKVGRNVYGCAAFAAIDLRDHEQLRKAVFYLGGAVLGFALPKTSETQFDDGRTWALCYGPGEETKPNSLGGHCALVIAYNSIGPICITWGKKQQMTWEFYDAYCDEGYAVVDDKDRWLGKHSVLDVSAMMALLKRITG